MSDQPAPKLSLLITHNEINERHGVAILIRNIFSEGKGMLTIRSVDDYDGQQAFGETNLRVSHEGLSRSQSVENVRSALGGKSPDRTLCIPYYRDDVLSALAAKELFDAPLCTYIMDDQNIAVKNIPDEDVRDLLSGSDLCLGISREMCEAYEDKYGIKFWLVPPVVEPSLIADRMCSPKGEYLESRRGILVGNIWSQRWLDGLRAVVRDSGASLDWFGSPDRRWLRFEESLLEREHIRFEGYLPQDVLADAMRRYPYAIVPTGSNEGAEDRPDLTALSLPSRVSYIVAASNAPIIVMGSRSSAAARFVERFQLGLVCDYDASSFSSAVERVCDPREQDRLRRSALDLARSLSSSEVDEWIWRSLENGRPHDLRFERF